MPKHAISALFPALSLSVALAGCQAFTASETVSEPDAVKARAARTAIAAEKGTHEKAKEAHAQPAEPEQAAPAETATASHILIRYAGTMRAGAEVTRTKDEAKKLAEEIAAKAAKGADFAALADQYTEDPSGKGRGGKLGTFGRGRMVPEFDKATFELAPGKTSGVVETAFGYHIIYREN